MDFYEFELYESTQPEFFLAEIIYKLSEELGNFFPKHNEDKTSNL